MFYVLLRVCTQTDRVSSIEILKNRGVCNCFFFRYIFELQESTQVKQSDIEFNTLAILPNRNLFPKEEFTLSLIVNVEDEMIYQWSVFIDFDDEFLNPMSCTEDYRTQVDSIIVYNSQTESNIFVFLKNFFFFFFCCK